MEPPPQSSQRQEQLCSKGSSGPGVHLPSFIKIECVLQSCEDLHPSSVPIISPPLNDYSRDLDATLSKTHV